MSLLIIILLLLFYKVYSNIKKEQIRHPSIGVIVASDFLKLASFQLLLIMMQADLYPEVATPINQSY